MRRVLSLPVAVAAMLLPVVTAPHGCGHPMSFKRHTAAAQTARMLLGLKTDDGLASAQSVPPPRTPQSKPHLVFAMIDDWGWFENGFHGNSLIKTPFIDKLVGEESAQIERHYAYMYCSPTRRSFLSGRVPPHSGQSNAGGATVDVRMHTIASKLQGAGCE